MFLLAVRNLRVRTGRTLFTIFAIALGVALVFATRIVGVAADEQAAAARESKLAGADLEVSPARARFFPVSIADEILKNSVVEKVAPIYRHPLTEGNLQLLGVDPARVLTPYELIAGQFITTDNEILLPDIWAAQHGLGVGQTVRLTIEGQPYEFTVIGLLKAKPLETPTAWVTLPTLQAALHQPSAVNSILVRVRQSESIHNVKEQLAESLGVALVVTSVQDGALKLDSLTAVMAIAFPFASVVVLLAAAYGIYNTFALTLVERQREIGQLRALGMTRGQILAQTLSEALLIALVGSVAGLPLGFGLGAVLTSSVLNARTISMTGDIRLGEISLANVTVPWDGVILGVGVGVFVTLAATFALARAAGRVSPLAALMVESSNKNAPAGRLYEKWGCVGALGLAVLFGVTNAALAAYLRQSQSAVALLFLPALLLLPPVIVVLMIPALMRGALWLIERAFPRSVVARLAVGNIRKQTARALLIAASFAISLMLVVAFAGIALGISTSGAALLTPFFAADYGLFQPGALASFSNFPPLPPALEADLAALRTKAQIFEMAGTLLPGYGYINSDVDVGNDTMMVSLDYLRAHPQLAASIEGTLDDAERYIAAGPTLLLTEVAARRHNLHLGDTTMVDTLEGPVSFTVGLIHTGFTIIPNEYGARYFGIHPYVFLVNALPGQDKIELSQQVQALAQKHNLQFVNDLTKTLSEGVNQGLGPILALFAGLTSISAIVVSLNLVNVLVASVLERQRELGTLRALGLTQRQVRGLVVAEAGLLGFVGSLLGVLGALVISQTIVQLFILVLATSGGGLPSEAPPLPWALALVTLILGPGIAMLTALYPADRAAGVNPADAMRAEGSTGFLKPAPHLGPIGLRGLIARLPLAAKLSFSLGVVFVLTVATLTAFRVDYERRLIEDNMRVIIARGFDVLNSSDAFKPDLDELNAEAIAEMQKLADSQANLLQAQFSSGDTAFDFGLQYLFIADAQNKILLSSRAEYNNTILTDTVEFVGTASVVRLTDWTGERVFEVALPIENKAGQRLGSARLGFSSEAVDNITQDIIRSSLWTMTVALAVAVVLTIFLTRRALAPVADVVQAAHAVAQGDLTRRVPETRWDDVGQLARAFNDMVSGLNDRERMRDLFGRYLSREVNEAVLAGRVTLGGERKTITCLYVDMRGSTTFAEKYPPEEVMSALNDYFEVIILATEAHGGIVNRFVGDEAVCVFGAPTPYRDHADRALQSALAMREGLAYLNRKRETLGLPILKFGMGLNSGEVVAGATGSEERQEYTVIGDAMNVGARVQALNKVFPDHDILLSEFTVNALKAEYKLVDLGPVELRGKSEPVRVFGMA